MPQASTGFSQCDSVMSYLLGETTGHETIYLLSGRTEISVKIEFKPGVTLGETLNEQNLE